MSGDHWRSQAASSSNDGHGLPSGRPFGSFGATGSSQQSQVLPPPPSNYPSHLGQLQRGLPPSSSGSAASPAAHNLSIADLTQSPAARSQYNTAPPPTQTQTHAPLSRLRDWPGDPNVMREMEMAELRAREEHLENDRQRQLDRLAGRQTAPIQSHVNIPLHQPVASKVQGSLQGPNGLLSNGASGGGGAAAANTAPFAAASSAASAPQPYMTQPSPGVASQQNTNGQQPILNDALSYLDQVKVRFSDQPDVYNRFLDIMKDFKSQAIDTPGVINRVSELFTGHPMLIQGFNTFLPPGYRIECGTDDNPDAIRVTTPSGTMTQSMQPRPRGGFDTIPPAGGQHLMPRREDTIDSNRAWGQPARMAGAETFEAERYEHENAMQQEQRNVSHLQNAATAAANGQSRHIQASSPVPPFGGPSRGIAPGATAASAAEAKRGVVEFNHAIDYVNKIKNRFAQQPEIYKQFLEILQTYQRESKPIQDVYAQVTQLFLAAPDLLEDFKQFLPESAAHAKAQAAARAQQEAEALSAQHGYLAPLPQTQTPRPTAKLPPMGQFDPPSTSKDNKKRKAPGALAHNQVPAASDSRMRAAEPQPANKRQKFDNKPKAAEIIAPPVVDPTLVPALPEPLPPAPGASTTQEEIGFFERAKKQIANRSSYTEFLKLVNLFTQDIIDKYTLAERVQSFIGSNPELMNYFRGMLGIGEHEEVVEARLRPDSGRVNLAHCRSFGPSYRHLPKRDQNKPCKGRDGMCFEVLNDVWASHPTWASEDSGFVAHRKNQYEEALHRIEEERHDYDFHIESCQRTIQLMQPLVSQIAVMNDQEKALFRADRGLGGASEAIPKRIILKIYGREAGNRVLEDMYARPAQVMPVVLSRLKQKLEEWKQVQREWEKVWRDQINKQFYKSLDHQGIAQKNADKKNFQLKSLVNDIQARYEEQKRTRDKGEFSREKHQLEYDFGDYDVLVDTTRLVVTAVEHDKENADSGIQLKIKAWLVDFVVRFFDLDREDFIQRVDNAVQVTQSSPEDRDSDNDSDALIPDSRKSKAKAQTTTLLQQALKPRNGKEASVAPTSKESTPAPDAMSITSAEQDTSATEEEDTRNKKWIKTAQPEVLNNNKNIAKDEPYTHDTYNFYANSNLYCFFRLFEMLYSRLLCIKRNETVVAEAVRRFKGDSGQQKPALALRMIDKLPTDFFKHVDGKVSYYEQILEMCCDILLNRGDKEQLEETLRRFYNHTGWQLYSVDRLVTQILRFLVNILTADAKEKSLDIANLFFKDREREQTTHEIEVQYRNQVKKMSKDGEVFRITWHPAQKSCTVRYFPEDDTTFDRDELSDEAKWQYYVATYTMTEPTEGVLQSKLRRTFVPRNISAPPSDNQKAYMASVGGLDYHDNQTVLIDVDSYKLQLQGDFTFNRPGVKARSASPSHSQKEAFEEKFVRNVAWMKDQRPDDVEARKAAWETGVKQGLGDFEAQFSDR